MGPTATLAPPAQPGYPVPRGQIQCHTAITRRRHHRSMHGPQTRPIRGIMPVIKDHPPFGLGISACYAGDRGTKCPVLAPHDHLHNKQERMWSGLTAIDTEPIKEQRNPDLEQPAVVAPYPQDCVLGGRVRRHLWTCYERNMDGTVPSSRPLT